MFTVSDAQITLWLNLLLWPFFRILGIFAADPFFSSRSLPVRARVGLALLLAILIANSIPPLPAISPVSPMGILIIAEQLLVGLAIGYTMRLVFSAFEMAGYLSGLQMGLGFASFYDPQTNANTAVVAQLYNLLLLLLFFAMNGHLVVIETIAKSFVLMPISIAPFHWAALQVLVQAAGQIFLLGITLSLPLLAALLITNLAIGVMSRAAPQFNVFAVGFPVTLAVGMTAIYFSAPYMIGHAHALINQATQLSYKIAKLFAGAPL